MRFQEPVIAIYSTYVDWDKTEYKSI